MILWFSGTGNTLQVATKLADALGESLVSMVDAKGELSENKRVIWCFPTYSWGVPPVVVEFIKNVDLKCGPDCVHFMVTTCGDDMGRTDRQWQRLMAARGWKAADAYSVIMPNTYVLMKGFNVDDEATVALKLAASHLRVREIADAVGRWPQAAPHDFRKLVRGGFSRIKSSVIYPWFVRNAMSPEPFHVTDGCTGCGTCARACPLKNIVMESGTPRWGDRCALCLRCYHICPRRAVAYGKATDGKGQYLNPAITQIL